MTETLNNNASLLNVEKIDTYIGQFHILEGVSVEVAKGSITVLLGKKWCRKNHHIKDSNGLDTSSKWQGGL